MSSRRLGGVVLLLASGLALLGPSAHSATAPVVQLRFGGTAIGQPFVAPANQGSDPDIVASVVTSGDGQALSVRSRDGQGNAIDFPDVDASTAGDRAVVKIVDKDLTDGDALSPGIASFTLTADFMLDSSSATDGGNNLVQRGLAKSSDQYKIQVDVVNDKLWPACAVGAKIDGQWVSSAVSSPRAVKADEWYQVRCRRTAHTLTITLFSIASDGTLTTWSSGRVIGTPNYDLTWPTTGAAPMSIGGKLRPNGTIETPSDQFNGVVDNVIFRIDD